MARPRHPTEVRDDTAIREAKSFAVHFRRGPFEIYRERASTLAAALKIEKDMNSAHGNQGRRAIVYAITTDGRSVAIPEHMKGTKP